MDPSTTDQPSRSFELATLIAERRRRGEPYYEFLDEPTLTMGVYHLPAGGCDDQSPHEHDEVYSVLSGRAQLRVEDRTHPAVPGSVLFVRAGVEHRFVEIEEDLTVLVFFSAATRAAGGDTR